MSGDKGILLLGKGGFGAQLGELLAACGYGPIVFLDDGAPDTEPFEACREQTLKEKCPFALVALGNNPLRAQWLQTLREEGYTIPVFCHPSAVVSPSAELGAGTVVLPFCYVGAGVKCGEGCILNAGAIIDHNAVLGTACHAAPGAIVKAGAVLAEFTKVESGEVVQSPWTQPNLKKM